jgi:hypothetical protein
MADDALVRELNIRVTRLEEKVHEMAEILIESGIFEDPSSIEQFGKIVTATGSGALAGKLGGWPGIGLSALGGFIWQTSSEIISDQDRERFQQALVDLETANVGTPNERQSIEYLYAHGLIGEDAWDYANTHVKTPKLGPIKSRVRT